MEYVATYGDGDRHYPAFLTREDAEYYCKKTLLPNQPGIEDFGIRELNVLER
jgi:hypothetical protein